MAFVLFNIYLNLIFLLSFCLPFVVSINNTKIQCNYQKYVTNGCPIDKHMVCNNQTNYCHCNQSDEYRISLGDTECLSLRNIDQKCVISDQCIKGVKNNLFCYFFDSNQQKMVKLETKKALELRQIHNKTIYGFCRCDDHYYYDYEQNQCVYHNSDDNLTPFFEEFFCKQCPIIDENSYCEDKSQTCVCKQGFVKNSYGKCVQIRQLYERCDNLDECVDPNSYCEPMVSQCLCINGYYPDPHKQHCIKGRALYEKCAEDKECSYLFGYCDPKRSQCFCDPNESVHLNMQCVKKSGYGQVCHHLFPDVVCEMSNSHTFCSKYTNRCVCENGYLLISNECQKININSNRFAFGDDFTQIDDNKNPMTYIVIVFCTVFGFTILASILIKLFRRPFTRTPLAYYQNNHTMDQINGNNSSETRRSPSAPPIYTESQLRESPQTLGSNSDNEDKPPSYEEAISGRYSIN